MAIRDMVDTRQIIKYILHSKDQDYGLFSALLLQTAIAFIHSFMITLQA